jgi:two-component system phosphate regulon sensor histidine kinase PhoR
MRWRLRPVLLIVAGAVPVFAMAIVYVALVAVTDSRGLPVEALAEQASGRNTAFLVGGAVALALALLGARGVYYAFTGWLDRTQAAFRAGTRGTGTPLTGIHELDAFTAALQATLRERDRRTGELLRERDELAFLLEAVNEGIVQIGSEGRLVRANRRARELLRLGPQIEGQRVAAVIRNPALREAFERAATGEAVPATEIVLDERQLLVAAQQLADKGGALAVLVDLTDLRRIEDVRRDFVANASHELKTPLTSIRGYAETLLSDDLPPDMQRTFLETINANAHRLHRIVEDLLDLSRIESGGWSPHMQPVPVHEVVNEAWDTLIEEAGRAGVTLVLDLDALHVWADPGALRQIFANLLGNAIRYTPRGGRITVHTSTAATPALALATGKHSPFPQPPDAAIEHPKNLASPAQTLADQSPTVSSGLVRLVSLEVRDTGSGIPSAALPRIFERFYRVDSARSRAAGGTGLGLAIVKHLVERMGGDIAAESQLGVGTTIRFRLPAPPVEPGS